MTTFKRAAGTTGDLAFQANALAGQPAGAFDATVLATDCGKVLPATSQVDIDVTLTANDNLSPGVSYDSDETTDGHQWVSASAFDPDACNAAT